MEEERPYGYYPRFPYKMGYGYDRYNYIRKQNADVQNRTPQYRQEQYNKKKENIQNREKLGTRQKNNNVEYKNSTNNERKKEEDRLPIFEIFGIKLYFDDILLVALIFFLYDEGVQDNMLFIALILLLLS